MKFNRQVINSSIERDIIIGLIVDTMFIEKIKPIFQYELLETNFAKTVARWCFDYYNEFNQAPEKTIQNIYESNKDLLDENLSETVYSFLNSISNQYNRKAFNTGYVIKESERYFKSQQILDIVKDVKVEISQGKIEKAELKILEYKEKTAKQSDSIDVFSNEAITHTFKSLEKEILFYLPGALGQLIRVFCREDFVGVAAPMKRGKTFTLVYWALRAAFAQCKVLFFSLEMSADKMNMRFYQCISSGFIDEEEEINEKYIEIPYFDEDNDVAVRTELKNNLTQERVFKKVKALQSFFKQGKVKLICEPSYSLNTDDIKNKINIERISNGFIPDVIVIDYADIMKKENTHFKDERHSINHTWLKLRSLAQEFNCCVIVATQGSRANFKKDIEEDDTSEDIRKLAHVTRMIGINNGVGLGEENDLAKKHSLRYNVIAERHGYYDSEKFVRVLKQFQLGKAYLDSRWVE